MKNFFLCLAAFVPFLLFSCKNQEEKKEEKTNDPSTTENINIKPQLADESSFNDTLNGKKIAIYYLKNGNLEASVTNYGGRLVNLLVPNKDNNIVDVVIGPGTFKDMYESKDYFGATIGRYGNRIANGRFSLVGIEYQLPQNNGKNTLHGGPEGFHNQVWDGSKLNDSTVQLTYLSKDGEMGFPGNMNVKVIYTLTSGNEMKIDFEATTDKTTVCNLTNHTYFNLNGLGTINNHLLQLDSDEYTPVDFTLIPLGKNETVKGTPFDFTTATAIGSRVNEKNTQIEYGLGYDHNFVVSGEANVLRRAAKVTGDQSGIVMEIFSPEPGIQFYGGNFMKSQKKMKYGTRDDYRTAFCLEPQHFPNSPNVPAFPSTTLKPGQVYKTKIVYKFSK